MRRPRIRELECTLAFDFPVILDASKPSVMLHKRGKYLLINPSDVFAADALRELQGRMACQWMKSPDFYNAEGIPVTDYKKIELWQHLKGKINEHPFCGLLRSYGIEIGTSPSLEGYIRKEYRRRELESAPYPAVAVSNDEEVPLFGRCCPGTNLLCIKDYVAPGQVSQTFVKGKRYLVTNAGGGTDGMDQVTICTEAVAHNSSVNMVAKSKLYDWTELDPPMEEWLDDSESVDFGATIDQKYPERVAEMTGRLNKLAFVRKALAEGKKHPLYEHVRLDAVLEAMNRGVINCKLMRMGKTSEAITICELWGSKKIGVIGTRNVRLAFRKEFQRLGMDNFVFVNKYSDLEKEGKYYLFTLDWIKEMDDPSLRERKDYENYLRAPERMVRRKVEWDKSDPQEILVYQHNPCPHCGDPMERPLLADEGVTTKAAWTTSKGYVCRSSRCAWQTDNRNQAFPTSGPKVGIVKGGKSHRGAAWAAVGNRLTHHKPGTYVDVALALHARCTGTRIKGRQCQECGATDGAWQPPRYRRLSRRFPVIVGDEIHNAKAMNTQNARALYAFRTRRRIGMTGTLLSNSPLDAYWPLYWAVNAPSPDFPWRGKDGSLQFEKRFCDFVYLEKPTGEIAEETGLEITKTIRKRTPFLVNPPDWWRTMQSKIVRRNYSDPLFKSSLIEAGMLQPRPSIKKVTVPMRHKQAAVMLDALRDFRKQYEAMVEDAEKKGNEVNKTLVIAKMSALRTIATSPERINQKFGYEVYNGPPGGGKMRQIVNLVADSVAQGKKVFILSDFIEMQIQVEKALHAYNPISMPSSWGDEKRVEAMELFAHDPERHVWVSGTRSVREAIDVSCADVTICCDLLWSPAWQCQAWSRTMAPTERDRDCEVYLMLSQNSLDEYIYTVFYSKMVGAEQALDRKVMNRRALDFDVKFFAQRVLEEEEALSLQIRDDFGDTEMVYMPELELAEERAS